MNDVFYTKQIKCPVCNNFFISPKLKTRSCMLDKKDEDFCPHYKVYNPIFYEIFVCPVCSYAASENSFDSISNTEKLLLKDAFSGRKAQKDFCKERTLDDAIDSFKLALFTANIKNSKSSIIAGLCLKIAWLYRYMQNEKEIKFLKHALDAYLLAFEKENLPIGNLNSIGIMYLIGELNRRLDNFDQAILWFGKVVSDPLKSQSPQIERLAREQWMTMREQVKRERIAQ